MGTGACGINCSVCRLHLAGSCSTCGSGVSQAGKDKLEAQVRLMGDSCPILQCAADKEIAYCMRDCPDFPCTIFKKGYPYAEGFLKMQERRLAEAKDLPEAAWPKSSDEMWERLSGRSMEDVCLLGGAVPEGEGQYSLQCLNEQWRINLGSRSVVKVQGLFGGEWDRQAPFLILLYLARVNQQAVSGKMLAPVDLFGGAMSKGGRNHLNTDEFEATFGRGKLGFIQAAEKLGSRRLSHADVSMRFHVFPKLSVDYLLWLADEEFPARLTFLLDSGIETFYMPDASSTLINLLTQRLIMQVGD